MSGLERLSIQDHDVEHRARVPASRSPVDANSRVRRLLRWIEQNNERLAPSAIPSSAPQRATHEDPISPSVSSWVDPAHQSCDDEQAPEVPGPGLVPISTASSVATAVRPTLDVWVAQTSNRIYYLKHGIYIAFPSEIPVPEEAWRIYDNEIKENLLPQLEVAFKAVEKAACRSGSTINWVSERVSVQMLGKDSGNEGIHLKLSPRICVRCPKSQKRYMEKVLRDYSLNWISRSVFGPIMVLTAAELSGSDYPPFIWEVGDESVPASTRNEASDARGLFVQGIQRSLVIQLHIGIPEGAKSPHGAFCRASVVHHGRILAQNYSRIGGLVSSRSETFGLTTAHHLLDGFWQEMTGHDHVDKTGAVSNIDSEVIPTASDENSTEISDSNEHDDSSDDDYDPWFRGQVYPTPMYPVRTTDPAEISNWTRVHLHLGTSFSNTAMVSLDDDWTVMFRMLEPVVFSDFALVRLPADWVASNFLNIATQTALAPSISPPTPDEAFGNSTTPVNILLGVDGIIEGFMESGYHTLVVRGQQFATRVIQLRARLLPRGSSGAWVMSAHGICGVIVASSQSEPFAYMIAAAQLQHDLNRVSRSASRENDKLVLTQPVDLDIPVMVSHGNRSSAHSPLNPLPSPSQVDIPDSWSLTSNIFHGQMWTGSHKQPDSKPSELAHGDLLAAQPSPGPAEPVHEDQRPSWASF